MLDEKPNTAKMSSIALFMKAKSHSMWARFLDNKTGVASASVILIYLSIALISHQGLIGDNWNQRYETANAPVSAQHWFGTNAIGQDVFARAMLSTYTSFEIGISVSFFSLLLGTILGGISGYCHRRPFDTLISWLLNTLDAIPFYLFVAAIAFAFTKNTMAMHIAMILTFWTSSCRLVRSEVIKLKQMSYIDAARMIGTGNMRILLIHILPNAAHIILVQSVIVFVLAIKTEVILSFLGMGTQSGVSWGIMIAESTTEVVSGHFANFIAASLMMFGLVIACNFLSDTLQYLFNPKTL